MPRPGTSPGLRVRALVESVATEVMHRVGRALGAGPLGHDEAHSRRVADLTVEGLPRAVGTVRRWASTVHRLLEGT